MNSALLTIFALFSFYLGYRFYSRFISDKIYGLDESIITPAHEFEDGIDFVPTKRHILFGHHFTSIAGAAPIIGPCIAAYWGWLPAILWVVLGTIFMGAVHDFGSLVISLKEKGIDINGSEIDQNGFTHKQKFFIGFAQVWNGKRREESLRTMIKTNPHPPGNFRVIGTLSNLESFYSAFGVKDGDGMFVDTTKRSKIW